MVGVISLIFISCFLIGVPIAFALGLAGSSYILFFEGLSAGILVRRFYHALDSFPLLAIPLFIMIGHLVESSGLLTEVVRWLQLFVGRMRGGIAYINVLLSMLFAGVSGTAVSDVASIGRVEIKMMKEAGYDLQFSAALTAASSIVGPIIPPSVAFIIYALVAGNISIGGLFLAGATPGFLLGGGLLVISYLITRKGEFIVLVERPELRDLVIQTVKVTPFLLLPVIIIGGILSGVFTATESAAVGVVYALLIGFLVYRRLRLQHVYDAMVFSARMSSILGMLIGGGTILSWILTRNQGSAQLANFVATVSTDPVIFMIVVAVSLLLIGMVMDVTATMITLIPLLTPVALSYGIEPLHFALVFVLTSMIGMITPPVGIVLFLVSSIGEISVEGLSKSIIPFVICEFAVVIICIFFPSIVLWLPQMLGF